MSRRSDARLEGMNAPLRPGRIKHLDNTSENPDIVCLHKRLLEHLQKRLGRADDASVLAITKDLLAKTARIQGRWRHPSPDWETLVEWQRDLRFEIASILEKRIVEPPHKTPEAIRQAILEIWSEYRWDAIRRHDQPSSHVARIAQYELACFRARLQQANRHDAGHLIASRFHSLDTCTHILCIAKPLWDAMRPLVLILRASPAPCVAPDLRYWRSRTYPSHEEIVNADPLLKSDSPGFISPFGRPNPDKPDPPHPWCIIPDTLFSWFHAEVANEQETDEGLQNLRTRFARFCLDRLKYDKRLNRKVEPNARWRTGLIRAAAELRTNPRGTGHRILFNVMRDQSENEQVRMSAQQAYEQMRCTRGLDGMSPRRAVARALAQILWAHAESLGIEVDADRAHSTIHAMVRRTTKRIEEVTKKDLYE